MAVTQVSQWFNYVPVRLLYDKGVNEPRSNPLASRKNHNDPCRTAWLRFLNISSSARAVCDHGFNTQLSDGSDPYQELMNQIVR